MSGRLTGVATAGNDALGVAGGTLSGVPVLILAPGQTPVAGIRFDTAATLKTAYDTAIAAGSVPDIYIDGTIRALRGVAATSKPAFMATHGGVDVLGANATAGAPATGGALTKWVFDKYSGQAFGDDYGMAFGAGWQAVNPLGGLWTTGATGAGIVAMYKRVRVWSLA